jgi:hypothetical protein
MTPNFVSWERAPVRGERGKETRTRTDTILHVTPAERPYERGRSRWLDAAGWMLMRGRFFGGIPSDLDAEAAFMYLVVIARAQAAAELAFERLVQAQQDDQRAEAEHKPSVGIDSKLRMAGEIHAFLVSAHLFWRTLDEMRRHLRTSELKEAWKVHHQVADETRKARDHIEHLPERIRRGRTKQPVMDKAVFREAAGAFDGTELTFGDETFDLRQILDSISRAEEMVAPRLEERLAVKFSPKLERGSTANSSAADTTRLEC